MIINPEKSYAETLDIEFENEATKQKEIEQGRATTYDKEWIISALKNVCGEISKTIPN